MCMNVYVVVLKCNENNEIVLYGYEECEYKNRLSQRDSTLWFSDVKNICTCRYIYAEVQDVFFQR